MLLLGIVFVVGALIALIYALELVGVSNKHVCRRLVASTYATETKQAAQVSSPMDAAKTELGIARYLAPPSIIERAERNLQLAGRPKGWSLRGILMAKGCFVVFGLLLAALFVQSRPTFVMVVLALFLIALGYFVPDLLIKSRAQERQEAMEKALADALDQITISIESGLSFEAAIARSADSGKGPLVEEFGRTVQDIRLGMSRRDAYLSLNERTTVDDLKRFTKSIIQAEEFGVPISSIVRTNAKEMRMKRKLRAEGKALKVPTIMLFPLVGLILPVLFVVILSPALMNASSTYGQ